MRGSLRSKLLLFKSGLPPTTAGRGRKRNTFLCNTFLSFFFSPPATPYSFAAWFACIEVFRRDGLERHAATRTARPTQACSAGRDEGRAGDTAPPARPARPAAPNSSLQHLRAGRPLAPLSRTRAGGATRGPVPEGLCPRGTPFRPLSGAAATSFGPRPLPPPAESIVIYY